MTGQTLTYAVVTPARNEADNLRRLARCMDEQTLRPECWLIVDNGSVDDTLAVARELAGQRPWARALVAPGEALPTRGGPVAKAFSAGVGELELEPDIVVKVDADVSFAADYFEQILARFAADPTLGIAGGVCYELEDGEWKPRFATGNRVRGAQRAYRWRCYQDVLPLENRPGWDGIDEMHAAARGWHTGSISDLRFYHHRKVGERDRSRRRQLYETGMANYYGGYRPSYLVLRALYRARREPAALALIAGYATAAFQRQPRCADPVALGYLRREQSWRRLPMRVREALGR
jgi:glycosyltransferase involved in cell wall biosynthesis